MNKKRIRQMSASLLRRVTTLPASRYLSPHREMLRELLEDQNYLQRFAPLYDSGTRLQCADILRLCRDVMDRLSPEPEGGWLAFTYDFARKSMFPEPDFQPGQAAAGPCGSWSCWRRTSSRAAPTMRATACSCAATAGSTSMR